MKNILVLNQKGGVGKTLATDALCYALSEVETVDENGNKQVGVPYNLYDLDGQGGLVHEPCEMPGAEISVVDTPGALLSETIDSIRESDVLVVVTRPTLSDVPATERTIEVVKNNMKKDAVIVYVVNGMNRFRACQEFMEYFNEEHANDLVFGLPQSEAFVQSSLSGVSIQQYNSKSPAAIAMKHFTDKVLELCGIDVAS